MNNNKSLDNINAFTYLEQLMDSLIIAPDAETEGELMDKIWSYSDPEAHQEVITIFLSVRDSKGKQVANNLSSAEGEVTVELTLSNNKKKWSKTIEFTPKKIENLYLLMRE